MQSAAPAWLVRAPPATPANLVKFAQLVVVTALMAGPASVAQTGATNTAAALAWTDQEKRAIARHGPWPQPVLPDPSNRASGKADAIALGHALFFDVRLSAKGDMACASCHQPGRALSDGRDRAHGRERLDRNTPGLWNAGLGRWFGWDGGADSLWGFALGRCSIHSNWGPLPAMSLRCCAMTRPTRVCIATRLARGAHRLAVSPAKT